MEPCSSMRNSYSLRMHFWMVE